MKISLFATLALLATASTSYGFYEYEEPNACYQTLHPLLKTTVLCVLNKPTATTNVLTHGDSTLVAIMDVKQRDVPFCEDPVSRVQERSNEVFTFFDRSTVTIQPRQIVERIEYGVLDLQGDTIAYLKIPKKDIEGHLEIIRKSGACPRGRLK